MTSDRQVEEMLIQYFIAILFIFSVSYGGDNNNNDSLQYILDRLPHEGITCEDKLSAALSILNESDIFYNHSIFNTLSEQIGNDLQENVKLYKLDKELLSKLEEYIGGKINIGLEKNIPDKIDLAIINHKLYVLNKLQTDLDLRIIRETKTLANDTLNKVNAEIERTLFELQNTTVASKLDAINAKVTDLESKTQRELQKFEDKINLKIDKLENQLLQKLETLTQSLNDNLAKIQKKPGVEQNNTRSEGSENTTTRNTLLNRTRGYWNCKKRTVSTGYDYSPVRMDSDTLNYISLESDDRGLTHYEISFAVQGADAMVFFSPVPKPGIGDGYFLLYLHQGGVRFFLGRPKTSDVNSIDLYQTIQQLDNIPKTTVPNAFTAYVIKIKNQTLELYKAGTDRPIYTYTDSRLRSVQYVGFSGWTKSQTTILYDCPPNFEETLF